MPTNESANADATDVDSAGLASAVNALFEHRIPVMHRLGIRIVELREGLVSGAAPLEGNLNYQGSMYAGPCSAWERPSAAACSSPTLTCADSPRR